MNSPYLDMFQENGRWWHFKTTEEAEKVSEAVQDRYGVACRVEETLNNNIVIKIGSYGLGLGKCTINSLILYGNEVYL